MRRLALSAGQFAGYLGVSVPVNPVAHIKCHPDQCEHRGAGPFRETEPPDGVRIDAARPGSGWKRDQINDEPANNDSDRAGRFLLKFRVREGRSGCFPADSVVGAGRTIGTDQQCAVRRGPDVSDSCVDLGKDRFFFDTLVGEADAAYFFVYQCTNKQIPLPLWMLRAAIDRQAGWGD